MSEIESRRLEEKERRRDEIIDAAEAVFGVVGFVEATMEQVARKARLSRALVYVYFKDKNDLHLAVAIRAQQRLMERFEQAVGRHKHGLDQIEAIGRAYVAFSQEFPVYFEALSRFEALDTEVDSEHSNVAACMQAAQGIQAIMVRAVEAGMRDGTIRADLGDAALTCNTLWAFMHGVIQLTSTKEAVLASSGITAAMLTRHALSMARRALEGSKA